jgi:hypothetical protein
VQHARPGPRLSFFHIPKLQWTLKPPYLNKKLQAMMAIIIYGLAPRRVSFHSLRICGAAAMAAAGMSEYEIKQMGGWKPDVFLDYVRNTTQLFERARRAQAKRAFTIQSIRHLNPGCANQGRTKQCRAAQNIQDSTSGIQFTARRSKNNISPQTRPNSLEQPGAAQRLDYAPISSAGEDLGQKPRDLKPQSR